MTAAPSMSATNPLRYAFNEAAKAATQFAPASRHDGPALDEGQAPGLEATDYYSPPAATWAYGVHAAIVEVDEITCETKIKKYALVHDCGNMINPTIVEGQVMGGVAQGIAGAMYEKVEFDDDGNISNAIPKASIEAKIAEGFSSLADDMTDAESAILEAKIASGVSENGDEYNSNIVISGLDPKLTFLKMLDEPDLPSDFVSAIKNFRIRGSSGKVNLALDALPNFTCLPGDGHHLRGAISISPSYDHLERAYDDAKYGNFSEAPFMDIILPSVLDPDMAPPGKHVMSCFVQYAPYDINGGWNDQKREAFGDAVINTIARYAPNIKDIILHRQVLTPADLESTFGLTEGNIFHGELTLQQLFSLRPAVKWADYTTPIKNYFQCGSGTHPGGGITGSPGEMAAKKILGTW